MSADRNAWAKLLGRLIDAHTKGKKAPFARLIGVDPRTLERWLRGEVDVKEENIRAVARAVGEPAADFLVIVGLYAPADLARPEPSDPREDPVIQAILADPRLTEGERMQLVSRQLEQIERDRERRQGEYEWWLSHRQSDAS